MSSCSIKRVTRKSEKPQLIENNKFSKLLTFLSNSYLISFQGMVVHIAIFAWLVSWKYVFSPLKQSKSMFNGTVKEKLKRYRIKTENWTIHIRHLSDVPVLRNWYKTVSKLYENINIWNFV